MENRHVINSRTGSGHNRNFMGALWVVACAAFLATAQAEKLQVADIVLKHLDSIGSVEARRSATSRVIEGDVRVIYTVGQTGQISGVCQLASQGPKILMAMVFGLVDYPHEQLAFDGKQLLVDQLKPGLRSRLGQFLYQNDLLSRRGLLSGTLSAGWVLLDSGYRKGRLRYTGSKMLEGRRVHELTYTARSNQDLDVSLFIEDGTFRHIRSRYSIDIPPSMAARPIPSDGRQPVDLGNPVGVQQLIEDFSDFRPEGSLMLPHSYKLQLSQNRATLFEWVLKLEKFNLEAGLTDADFRIR